MSLLKLFWQTKESIEKDNYWVSASYYKAAEEALARFCAICERGFDKPGFKKAHDRFKHKNT